MRNREAQLTPEKPRVQVTETMSVNGHWVTDGTVTFGLREDRATFAALQFKFRNATSEADAVRQGAEQLKEVAQGFTWMTENILDGR